MITQEQETKIREAIEKARNPGECQYESEGKPCCIVGQLAHLEGVSIGELKETWDTTGFNGNSAGIAFISPEELRDYPMKFLSSLQVAWDSARTPEMGRVRMFQILEDRLEESQASVS